MKNEEPVGSIDFDMPKNRSNVIKVIGVGGGGGNAINHMYEAGINGVDFAICNTDAQALSNSPVPNKIQLGVNLTEGLGAGANPEVGEQAALESMEEIKAMLGPSTKMVFITAGMGGGTGTGAAPVIAKAAKEMEILTVGIVTIPFQFEGISRCQQAQKGIDRLRENVDSLIVVNNNKLREIYGNLGFRAGFAKADEVLAIAAKGIAEVITHHYMQNIDLRDAKTVLANSGTAIMGSAEAEGSGRAKEAISKALDSPLLNDNKITGAKNVLLLIVSGSQEITIDEIGEINDHIQIEAGYGANIIMGIGEDESLGEAVSVTIIATGFNTNQQDGIVNSESKKIIHNLEEMGEGSGNGEPSSDGTRSDEVRDPYVLAEQRLKSEHTSESVGPSPEEDSRPAPVDTREKKVYRLEDEGADKYVETTELAEHVREEATAHFIEESEASDEPVLHTPPINLLSEEGEQLAKAGDRTSETEVPVALSILRELPVEFEWVLPETVAEEIAGPEDDFVIIESTDLLRNMEVVGAEVVDPEESAQRILPFDMPLSDVEPREEEPEHTVVFNLNEDVRSMEVEYEELQEREPRLIRRDEEAAYLEEEARLMAARSEDAAAPVEREVNPLLVKTTTEVLSEAKHNPRASAQGEEDPFFRSISDKPERPAKAARALKEYNYRFKHNRTSIEDIENEPAYKRQGIELQQPSREQNISKISLSEDTNNEAQLRTNNSFLHDNVD